VIQPTKEQLAQLTRTERFWFRVADFCLRHFKSPIIVWNHLNMIQGARIILGPRWVVHGAEHLAPLTKQDRFVIVANHRSFFDFYAIGGILWTRSRLSKHFLFPVRAPFFYDSWAGGLVNGWMSGFYMFPPILRSKEGREFNNYALDRMVAELERPGQLLGIHPEGTRGKGDDPTVMLKTQPGVGRIVLAAPQTRVLPVFITGMSNSMWTEFKRSWLGRAPFPIDVYFGAPIDFDDLRQEGQRMTVALRAAHRAMDGVKALAESHRALTEE
jgi:1-acyl-sn-glycerol-3-phosphate acyltransferase